MRAIGISWDVQTMPVHPRRQFEIDFVNPQRDIRWGIGGNLS